MKKTLTLVVLALIAGGNFVTAQVNNKTVVCRNGKTLLISTANLQAFLQANPGATVGACSVTECRSR